MMKPCRNQTVMRMEYFSEMSKWGFVCCRPILSLVFFHSVSCNRGSFLVFRYWFDYFSEINKEKKSVGT